MSENSTISVRRQQPDSRPGVAAIEWHMRQVFFNLVAVAILELVPGFSRAYRTKDSS